MSAFYPPTDDNHSQLFAYRSGSLNGFIRIAPLCLALMGILFTPTVFAAEVDMPCKYDNTTYSIKCGDNNTANSQWSSVVGYHNTASGQSSSALGYHNTASGYYSSAVGYYNTASGRDATAVGTQNTASADDAVALGKWNYAQGYHSSAIGYNNSVEGYDPSAVGSGNYARNDGVQVFGYENNRALWELYYEDEYMSQLDILDGVVSMGTGAVVLGYRNN